MTEKRSAKEVDEAPTPQPPLLSSADSTPQKSQGDMEKAVTELIIDFDTNAEEEGPYEALYNAVSCHSLDSVASGRSSDRESVHREAEAAGVKAAGVRPVRGPGPQLLGAAVPRAYVGAGAVGPCAAGPPCPGALPLLILQGARPAQVAWGADATFLSSL